MKTTMPGFWRGGKPLVSQLRKAALTEINTPTSSSQSRGKPTFDGNHKKTPSNDTSIEDFDNSNGVAKYPGPNVIHIGNGSGGVRR